MISRPSVDNLKPLQVCAAFEVVRLNFEVCVHGVLRSWMFMAIAARTWTTALCLPSTGWAAGDG